FAPPSAPSKDDELRDDAGPVRGITVERPDAPVPEPAPEQPRDRALHVEIPQRAGVGRRISLLVRILLADASAPGRLLPFVVPPEGKTVVVTVSAPGLDAEGDLEQDVLVPAQGHSDPVRFAFRTRGVGLQDVLVRAFHGG